MSPRVQPPGRSRSEYSAPSPDDHARLAALETASDPLDARNERGDLTLVLGETGPYLRARLIGERIVAPPWAETPGSRGATIRFALDHHLR